MAKLSALIVEDNSLLLDVFSSVLRRVGYGVQVVTDGQSALNRLENRVPDLLMLDMHLPGVTGMQVFQHIKSDVRYEKMLVMIITADAELEFQYRNLADVTLLKPVGVVELQSIAKHLKAEIQQAPEGAV